MHCNDQPAYRIMFGHHAGKSLQEVGKERPGILRHAAQLGTNWYVTHAFMFEAGCVAMEIENCLKG